MCTEALVPVSFFRFLCVWTFLSCSALARADDVKPHSSNLSRCMESIHPAMKNWHRFAEAMFAKFSSGFDLQNSLYFRQQMSMKPHSLNLSRCMEPIHPAMKMQIVLLRPLSRNFLQILTRKLVGRVQYRFEAQTTTLDLRILALCLLCFQSRQACVQQQLLSEMGCFFCRCWRDRRMVLQTNTQHNFVNLWNQSPCGYRSNFRRASRAQQAFNSFMCVLLVVQYVCK